MLITLRVYTEDQGCERVNRGGLMARLVPWPWMQTDGYTRAVTLPPSAA